MTKYLTLDEQEVAIKKLPKWAQRKIDSLERTNEHLRTQLTAGPENSDTFARNMYPDPNTPLGRERPIRFFFSGSRYEWIDVKKSYDTLSLSAEGRVVIEPRASNSFVVRFCDD